MTVIKSLPKTETSGEQQNEIKGEEQQNSSEDYSKWGYDLYPDRSRLDKKRSISDYMFGKGREPLEKIRCERAVYKCIKTSPLVQMMVGALKAAGCTIDIRRHIACEECAEGVSGGYDPILNQVITNFQTLVHQ